MIPILIINVFNPNIIVFIAKMGRQYFNEVKPKMNKSEEDMWNRLKEPAPIIYKYGTQCWYNKAGELHRENDLPAIIHSCGTKSWYKNGKRHRDNDLPAVIREDGYNAWYKNGKRHRENDLPSRIWENGNKKWYSYGEFIKREHSDE